MTLSITVGILFPFFFFVSEIKNSRLFAPAPWRFVLPFVLNVWGIYMLSVIGEYRIDVDARNTVSQLYGPVMGGLEKPWIVEAFGLNGSPIVVMLIIIAGILLSIFMIWQNHKSYAQASNADSE